MSHQGSHHLSTGHCTTLPSQGWCHALVCTGLCLRPYGDLPWNRIGTIEWTAEMQMHYNQQDAQKVRTLTIKWNDPWGGVINTDVSICEQHFAVVAGLYRSLVSSTCSQLVVWSSAGGPWSIMGWTLRTLCSQMIMVTINGPFLRSKIQMTSRLNAFYQFIIRKKHHLSLNTHMCHITWLMVEIF